MASAFRLVFINYLSIVLLLHYLFTITMHEPYKLVGNMFPASTVITCCVEYSECQIVTRSVRHILS
jgi:hypothetical protein